VALAACGTDGDITVTRFIPAPNAAQGIYTTGTALPVGYAAPVQGLPLQDTIIASNNLAATVIELGGGRQLRLFGRVSAVQDTATTAAHLKGVFDVYLSEATPGATIPGGPHALAVVTGGEISLTPNLTDATVIDAKQLVLQLDFQELAGQQSGEDAAFFDGFDGGYALVADADAILLYDVSPDPAFVIGSWTGTGDPNTQVELSTMTVDPIGNLDAVISGPLDAYCAALASPATPAPFTTLGEMFFIDVYTGVSPTKNAYLIEGTGSCSEDNTVSISYTALGWLSDSADTQSIGTMNRLNFYAVYRIRTSTDSATFGTRWQLTFTL
jgi:hypothetical protein